MNLFSRSLFSFDFFEVWIFIKIFSIYLKSEKKKKRNLDSVSGFLF